jgi:hypothetical protein
VRCTSTCLHILWLLTPRARRADVPGIAPPHGQYTAWPIDSPRMYGIMATWRLTYQSESTTECQTWLAWRYVCRARTNDNERRAGTNGHSCTWVTMRVLRSHCTGMRARIRPTRSIPTAACFSGCLWVPRSKAISGMHLSSFGRALSSRQHGTGPCISCSPQK